MSITSNKLMLINEWLIIICFVLIINISHVNTSQYSTICDLERCEQCNLFGECIKCKEGYELKESKCGITQCSHISNCNLCLEDQFECLKCNGMCVLKKGECNCTERPIVIGVCVLIGIIVVTFVIFALSTPGIVLTRKIRTKILQERNIDINREINNTLEKKEIISNDLSEFEKLYDMNKVFIGKGNKDKQCVACKSNSANVKLDCGCYLCFEDAKNITKSNNKKYCDKCHKEIHNETVITCGICFQNKSELSKFPCCCALWVCYDCFINCKRETNNCPACRDII